MALLLPGLLLVSNLPTASAAAPQIGRVTVSGPDILVDGVKPAQPFFGVCDTTALAFAIDNYINGNHAVAGWTSVFNGPDTSGNIPVTPNDTPDKFWNQYFAQMHSYGVNLVRIGAGDTWGTAMQYNAWMNHHDQYFQLLHSMSYYAQANGVWLCFVVAGAQEYPTNYFGGSGSVFDPSTSAFTGYVNYAKATMVELENENAIAWYDMFNEPDHNNVNANYWHGNKVSFNTWENAVADATKGVSSHPRVMGVAGFGNLFGMSEADFDLATGHTGFELADFHYYGSNSDAVNFQNPEQWARNAGKPLFWSELGYNGVYPLVRYDFGEKAIWAAGGQAITSMVLTGTPGYPYNGGASGQGQVPMPQPWPEPAPVPAPTEQLKIASTPAAESKVGVPYEYKVETSQPASIDVSTDAPFLGFDLADSTVRGTAGTAGNYSVSIRASVNSDVVYQNYTLTVTADPSIGNVTIQATPVSPGEYNFSYVADLSGDRIASVSWDFGDGNTSAEQSPIHHYLPGDHLVTLSVTDASGVVHNATYSLAVPSTSSGNGTVPGTSLGGSMVGAIQWGTSDTVLMTVGLICATLVGLIGYLGLVKGVEIPFFRFRLK